MKAIFALLFAYQLKHYFADYLLQGSYMLGKFKRQGWVLPLLSHVAVHAAGTALIAILAGKATLALQLAVIDAGVHFAMDRLKASPDHLGYFKALSAREYDGASFRQLRDNKYFWWILGFDQMVHHCTHYFCIWVLVR